jgi:translation initiation factor IF-2
MPGISNELLKLSATVREINVIVDKLEGVVAFVTRMTDLEQLGIFLREEIEGIIDEYKAAIMAEITAIIAKKIQEANEIAQTSVAEANDKVKNITPVIAGVPVIIPPPATYIAENVQILLQVAVLTNELADLMDRIQDVLG